MKDLICYSDTGSVIQDNFLINNTCIFVGRETSEQTSFFQLESLRSFINNANKYKRNEELLIGVVRNFIRKENFTVLHEEFNNDEITETQFENELKTNSNRYTINICSLQHDSDLENIVELVDKIGNGLKDFSVSDVSEMFSVSEQDLLKPSKAKING